MWIAINPAKAHRFTTKGINLSKSNPSAFVPPDLESEFMAKIRNALRTGEIIEIESNSEQIATIPKQAAVTKVDESEIDDKVIRVEGTVDEETGKKTITLTMPDKDGKVHESKEGGPAIILTDIVDTPLEDEAEGV